MRTRTANWFVCRVSYDKTMEDGLQKKVKELYVVDAMSFTEAETRIIDEKTDKEKKTAVNYLVQGSSLENARKNIDEVMGGTMIDYVIAAVAETSIMDVFEYSKEDKD